MLDTVSASELQHVGKTTRRVDMVEKLTGQAMYVSDMIVPGMLYARVKTSPHARARIVKIDTSAAEAITGVRAVVTGKDLEYKLGLYIEDKDILARNEVRHFGEAVAAVAADTLEIAQNAVDAIEVTYEELEPVLHPKEAVEKGAALVHPDLGKYHYMEAAFTPVPGTNIANHTKLRKGDIEKGFEEAEWILEREYTNPSVQHVPMETHV